MTDFAQRRTMMVDTQVRPNDVTSYPVIEAMLNVPREQFVPETLRDVAYAGHNIELGAGRVLFAGGVTAGLAPHLQAAASGGAIDFETARARMIDTYAGMPYRPALVATLRLYLAALAEYDTPSLVHCVAGKDRTGFAVAIVHRLLGVHEDDLMHDYLLTNTAGKIEERIAQGATHIRSRYGAEIHEDAIRALMSVNPAYLDAALATVRRDHGDIPTYAEAVLNLTPAMREAMVDRLVV